MSFSYQLLVIVLVGLIISWSYADECLFYGESKCECAFADGSGYSLKTLVVEKNQSIITHEEGQYKFIFSPCEDIKVLPEDLDFTNGTNECANGYSLCVYDKELKKATILGSQKDIGFIEDDKQKLSVTFGKGKENKSTIILECAQFADISVLYAPKESKIADSHLYLFSQLSCKQQIYEVKEPGFFSTFFLVLFIMFLLYMVLGMAYQYFVVGARGFEILPNYDFWCKVWISIKLGFLYLKNGCRVIPTADSYDAI